MIQSKADWVKMAHDVIPQLPDYAREMGCAFHQDRAQGYWMTADYKPLWRMFQQLWEDLPEAGRIRVGPFFELCELCSEVGALDQ